MPADNANAATPYVSRDELYGRLDRMEDKLDTALADKVDQKAHDAQITAVNQRVDRLEQSWQRAIPWVSLAATVGYWLIHH